VDTLPRKRCQGLLFRDVIHGDVSGTAIQHCLALVCLLAIVDAITIEAVIPDATSDHKADDRNECNAERDEQKAHQSVGTTGKIAHVYLLEKRGGTAGSVHHSF